MPNNWPTRPLQHPCEDDSEFCVLRPSASEMLIIEIFAIFHLTFAIEIRKSPNDPREYRFVKLKSNGLPTILISDKNAEKAAAALQVAVGSLTEPKEYPGLAHFLEHILFLGTKKYPETGDFTDFIEKHGGGANAFTADDRTVYMFEVEPKIHLLTRNGKGW